MNSSKKSILNSNFTYLAAFVLPVIMMMGTVLYKRHISMGKRMLSEV